MNVLVFGAGAVGSLLGGLLARHHDVALVGRDPHMAAVRAQGLRIEGRAQIHVHPAAATSVERAPRPDLVLVAVRATQTREAALALAPAVPAGTPVVTVQNGLGNLETLRDGLPGRIVLAAPTTVGAMVTAPGVVVVCVSTPTFWS